MEARLDMTAVNGSAPGLPYARTLGYPAVGARSMAFTRITSAGTRFANL